MTAADLQRAINHALGLADDLLPADVDGNGAIDAVDIQKVVLYILNAT